MESGRETGGLLLDQHLLVVPPNNRDKENPTVKARIGIITLGVDDLQVSLKFYRDGLGLLRKDRRLHLSAELFFRIDGRAARRGFEN